MRFAMFFLGEYINMFTVAALATTMFLGGPQAPPGIAAINDGMFNEGWWGLLWFTVKLWMFMFVFVWLRGSLPRVRYDQFMRFGWKFLIPATLAWVVLVAFFRAGQNGWLGLVRRRRLRRPHLPGHLAAPRRRHRRARPRPRLAVGPPRRGQGGLGAPHRARGDRPVRRGLPRAAPARPAPARALARRTGPDLRQRRPRRPLVADEQKKSGFFSDLFAPVGGFGVTFSTMFRKVATEEYPEEKRPTQPRFHGRHQLNRHPDGLEKCIGCELCAWACPADAILVEGAEQRRLRGRRRAVQPRRALRPRLPDQLPALHLLRAVHRGVPDPRADDDQLLRARRQQPRRPDLHQGPAARPAAAGHAPAAVPDGRRPRGARLLPRARSPRRPTPSGSTSRRTPARPTTRR